MHKKPTGSQRTDPERKRPAPFAPRTRRTGGSSSGRLIPVKSESQRSGREEVGSRLAWLIGGGLAAVVALLVLIGIYNDRIGPARNTAITVGKHSISLGYYRDRLKAAAVDGGDPSQVGAFNKESTTTDLLETEQVYLQRAASLGVTVSDAEIAAAMAQAVHAPVGPDSTVTDLSAYEILVRGELQRTGLSLDQFRAIAKAQALKTKVQQKFRTDVPKQTLAIKGLQLLFTSEEQGRAAQDQLGNGDSFNDIAGNTTADPSLGHAQPLDWTPVPFGLLPGDLDGVASQLMPGQVSDLIMVTSTSAPQWVLLNVTDRDSNHDVSDTQRLQIGNKQEAAWLDQQKQELGVHSFVDGSNAQWAAVHTDLPQQAPATPTPAPNPRIPGGRPGVTAPNGQPGLPPGAPGAPPVGPPGAAPAGPPAPAVPNGTP